MRIPPSLALIALLWPVQSAAATLSPETEIFTARPTVSYEFAPVPVSDLIGTLTRHFVNLPGETALPFVGNLAFQGMLLCLGLFLVLKSLPSPPDYPEVLASSAMARTRSTIARNPLDRWAERWSFNPRRPNSVAASTFSTSDTDKPL